MHPKAEGNAKGERKSIGLVGNLRYFSVGELGTDGKIIV